MSKYFSFCNQRNARASSGQSKTKTAPKQTLIHKISWGLCLRSFLVFMIVCLAGGYVWLTNFSTTKGFAIADLESEINNLQEQNKNLSDQMQELKSLTNVEARAAEMDMVSVGSVEYLSVSGGVALR